MSYKRGAKSQDKTVGKAWRILGESIDGKQVILGKYETEESAKADMARILEEGFYRKIKIAYSPIEPKPGEAEEAEAEVVVEERRPRAKRAPAVVEEAEPEVPVLDEEEEVEIDVDEPVEEEEAEA